MPRKCELAHNWDSLLSNKARGFGPGLGVSGGVDDENLK
jgi:hypothetical protein